jgi:hypothetical protein
MHPARPPGAVFAQFWFVCAEFHDDSAPALRKYSGRCHGMNGSTLPLVRDDTRDAIRSGLASRPRDVRLGSGGHASVRPGDLTEEVDRATRGQAPPKNLSSDHDRLGGELRVRVASDGDEPFDRGQRAKRCRLRCGNEPRVMLFTIVRQMLVPNVSVARMPVS